MAITSALAAVGIAAYAQDDHGAATHSAALHEGKYSTGGHAAIHREDPAPAHDAVVAVAGLWHSKYVSEGRNNLEHGGLCTLEGVIEWSGIFGGAWFGAGDSEPYQELNLFIEYGFELGSLDFSLGYSRLEFLEDHTGDNEFAAGAALNDLPYLVPGLNYVYSTDAEGGFLEVSLKSEIAFFGGRLSIEPHVLQAFDFGYASKAHDGPNHFQAGIGGSLALTEHLDLVGSVSHSWAQADVENDGLGDLSWAAIGLAATF